MAFQLLFLSASCFLFFPLGLSSVFTAVCWEKNIRTVEEDRLTPGHGTDQILDFSCAWFHHPPDSVLGKLTNSQTSEAK